MGTEEPGVVMEGERKEGAVFVRLETPGMGPGYDPSLLSRQVLRKCSKQKR